MRYKKFFMPVMGAAILMLAIAAGYLLPKWQDAQTARRDLAAFDPPVISPNVQSAFAREFARMNAATEPLYLPQGAILYHPSAPAPVSMDDFKGTPVLVNLWATWCAPCVVELPALKRLAEHYKDHIRVIGISLDTNRTPAQIQEFLKSRQLGDFAAYTDDSGAFAAGISLRGLPTTFLIGENGHILYRLEGDADWTSAAAKAFFDEFLGIAAFTKDGE